MPAHHCLRPDNGECGTGIWKQPADPAQNQSIAGREWQPAYPTPAQHNDLLPKHQDLCFQRRPRSKQIEDETEDQFDETQHPAPASPDSVRHANRVNLRQGQAGTCH